ncbi:MAG TPA: hypothetical protein VGR79_00160 [Stellaceae bacterium]|nr:hypothetical protein [Stellaceae bacterium]
MVSILAITYKAFNVTIENIPIEGLNIRFEKGAFAFLLLCGAVYFGVTFVLYYLIDIKNVEETPHQQNTTQKYHGRIKEFQNQSVRELDEKIIATLSEPYYFSGRMFGAPDRLLQNCEMRDFEINETALQLGTQSAFFNIASRNIGGGNALNPKTYPEVYEKPAQITLSHLRDYRRRIRRYRLLLRPWLISVRFMYAFRNYGTDGIFPIGLALFAIAAMYNAVDVRWITPFLPPGAR